MDKIEVHNRLRASALMGFGHYVAALGGNANLFLEDAGIDYALVGRTDAFIDYRRFINVLESCAKILQQPLFGLHLSTHQPLDSLGPVAAIARCAPTVLQGLAEIARYIHHYSPVVQLSVEINDGHVDLIQDVNLPVDIPRHQITDLKLGLAMNFLVALAEKPITPVGVQFSHAYDQYKVEYRQYFRCPIKFAALDNRIRFSLKDLETPIKSADSFLHELAEQYVGIETLEHQPDRAVQVSALVARLLPTGQCTLNHVAERLLIHPRTLQRQLAAVGTSFDKILDSVREKRANNYLAIANMPLSKVAEMLGFVEQASFNKASVRWWGHAPSVQRKHLSERLG